MILIVGGTGNLGQIIARRLLLAGEAVRVMTRNPGSAATLADAGAEIMQGDLRDTISLTRACEGATAVIAAANAILGRGKMASVHVDDRGNKNLVDAAVNAGVQQFVLGFWKPAAH